MLLTFLLLSPSLHVQAEAGRFVTTVTPGSVNVGDRIQVVFTLQGAGKNFKAPSFQDFNVLMGPSQSSNVSIINGSVTQSISFTYYLEAVKEGTFKIGGAEIVSEGSKLISNIVTVNVGKGTAKQQGSGQQGQQGGESAATSKNVFIRASVDKKSAFRGEAILVTYRLYTRVALVNYTIDKLPSLNGFWSQDIELPQQLEFHQENYDGVNYNVADLKKIIVFPQRSGTLEIDAMQGQVVAQVQVKKQRSNDPWDQFFNDPFFGSPFGQSVQNVKVPLKSDKISISVKELPAGAPESFTGAVGKFSCEVSLDKDETKANDPVTLKIKVSGKGNLKLIEAPVIEFPPDMETYEPKESVNSSTTAGGVSGSKTFEYLVIPRTAGEYKIPVKSFSYFDLDKKEYVEIPSPEFSLRVTKGKETITTSVSSVNKTDVQLIGKDILFIKTSAPDFTWNLSPFFGSALFYVFMTVPFLLTGMLLWLRRRYRARMSNISLVKSQLARKMAMKRLSESKKHLDRNEKDKFLDELSHALWGFISDKLGIPASDLSRESAADGLRVRNVPESLIASLHSTLDQCEFARFAGGTAKEPSALYADGISIITQLEESIK